MSEFKRVRELGLEVRGQRGSEFVNAHDLEALLEKGVRVHGGDGSEKRTYWATGASVLSDTHTALLIDIKPLAKDSAESLLREMCEEMDTFLNVSQKFHFPEARDVRERARKLLDSKKGGGE